LRNTGSDRPDRQYDFYIFHISLDGKYQWKSTARQACLMSGMESAYPAGIPGEGRMLAGMTSIAKAHYLDR